jgi:nucleotide-binding universal stress UspA family protein
MNAYITAIEHKHQIKPGLIWEEGLPAEAIIRTARKNEPDLIVCGSHGASGYRDSFIGSTAYTIIKYATCPVLTIPAGQRHINFRKMLLPLRPIHGALRNYYVFLNIAAESSQLHVLDLSGNNEDDEQLVSFIVDELKDKIEGHNVTTRVSKVNGATIPDRVLNMINRDRFDIVLLTPSIDMTNKQLFIGPHTQKIINQSPIPVLVIKRNP